MIAIRREIAEIETGRWKVEASPLRHAPHTVHDIADDTWARAYTRAEGCFPAGTSRTDKYWSPVGRVDNVYGDRNLVCSCPPVAATASQVIGTRQARPGIRMGSDNGANSKACFAWFPAPQAVIGQFGAAPPAVDRVVSAEIIATGENGLAELGERQPALFVSLRDDHDHHASPV